MIAIKVDAATVKNKLKIGIIGDIIAADSPLMSGQGVYSSCRGNYDSLFSSVIELTRDFDFLVGNFEMVLVEKIGAVSPSKSAMKVPLGLASTLQRCKFKYLSIANNHTMEYGPGAFSWMCEHLQAAGFKTFGHRAQPFIVAHDPETDIRVGLFAFSTVPALYGFTPEYYFVDIQDPREEQRLLAGVKHARQSCDQLLVLPHWGNEFVERPAPWQFVLAEKIIRSGADVILGAHAHVIQPAYWINKRPVFFCMGNFISDYFQERLKKNLFVTVSCGKDSLAVSNRVFSCDERFKIHATENKIEMLQEPQERESAEQYASDANMARRQVRRELIFYLLKYPQRWIFRSGTWSWFMKRALFLLINRRKIKKNPNAVYAGPIH